MENQCFTNQNSSKLAESAFVEIITNGDTLKRINFQSYNSNKQITHAYMMDWSTRKFNKLIKIGTRNFCDVKR